MAVPYTFANATTSIPLSQLDSNFATGITLGNTTIQLGNTVTTLNNMTLANVTVSSGNVTATNVTATNVTSPASTALTLQSNAGNTALTIDTSQNVGIGTSSPSTFSANSTYSTQLAIVKTDQSTTLGAYYQSGVTQYSYINAANATNNTANPLVFSNGANTERMRIDTSGRVTIPYQPGFMAGIASTSDATITNGNYVPFNTVTGGFNRGSNFNTSTYLFTAPVAGVYYFVYSILFTGSGGNTVDMQSVIVKNGSAQNFTGGDAYGVLNFNPTVAIACFSCGVYLNLAANDTVGVKSRSTVLRIYQGHCSFGGYLLG